MDLAELIEALSDTVLFHIPNDNGMIVSPGSRRHAVGRERQAVNATDLPVVRDSLTSR